MTPPDAHNLDKAFLVRLREHTDSVHVAEKRAYLKAVAESSRRNGAGALSAIGAEVVRLLAEDEAWQVRQDVAELLIHLRDDTFIPLITKLADDPNGYVKRSAERSRERRRKAVAEAKRASRGVEDISQLYQSLTKQIGGEVAEKAVQLGEKRFLLLADALVHDLLGLLATLTEDGRKLLNELSATNSPLKNLA